MLVAASEREREGVGQRALSLFFFLAVTLFFPDYVHLDKQLQKGEEVLVQVDGHLDEQRGEEVLMQVHGEVDVQLHEQQQQKKGEGRF